MQSKQIKTRAGAKTLFAREPKRKLDRKALADRRSNAAQNTSAAPHGNNYFSEEGQDRISTGHDTTDGPYSSRDA